jgi:hypothetical protein
VKDHIGKTFIRVLAALACFSGLSCTFPARALSRVVVHDTVAVKDRKVMLRAETRGKFFSKGGELVEFLVDNKSIGKNLSGGDGIAYKQFVPAKSGLHGITARSNGDEGTGLLLSLERGASIVFVDVEGSLLEGPFSLKPKQASQDAIKKIHEVFPIVFLQTTFIGVRVTKEWLERNAFIESPVLEWRQGKIFEEIAEKGLKIRAVIGGPKVIESLKGDNPLVFSFEKAKDAEKVKGWEEISKKLMKIPE